MPDIGAIVVKSTLLFLGLIPKYRSTQIRYYKHSCASCLKYSCAGDIILGPSSGLLIKSGYSLDATLPAPKLLNEVVNNIILPPIHS